MGRNNRSRQSDAWMPGLNNAESTAAVFAHSDPMDERLGKFRVEEFSRLPYKSGEPPDISHQDNELNRKFWMHRDVQRRALMPRKLSRSVNSGGDNMDVFHLERSSTGPRSSLFIHREEDSFSSQEMVPDPRNSHRNELQIEDELYPVLSGTMDYQQAAALNKGYTASSFGSKKGVDSQHEGSFTALSEYSMQSFEGAYSNSQSRFQEGPYDHLPLNGSFQEGDRLFSGDSYLLQSSSTNGAYNFPVPMRHRMDLNVSQMEMSLAPNPHTCTCCKKHAPSQAYFKPRPWKKYPTLDDQHLQTHSYFQDYGNHKRPLSKNNFHSLQVRHKIADPLSQAVQARKENTPPLPGPYAAPYVVCQGCDKVLQISTQLHFERSVLKVRCSACRKVSKFCNLVHPCYQIVFKEGKAANSLSQAQRDHPCSEQKLASAAVGTYEMKSTVQETVGREEMKQEGQSDGEVKQMKTSESPVGIHNPSSCTESLRQEQGLDETDDGSFMPWSRSGTFHEDSSSLFSASGSVSTKHTALDKLQEPEQLDNNIDFIAPRARHAEAKDSSDEIDSTLDQKTGKGPFSLSEDLQGLMLECLQEGSCNDLKAKSTSQTNQSHQDAHHRAECLSDDNNQVRSMSPREQTYCLEHSSNSSHALLPQTEKTDCHTGGLGNNQAEAFDDGAMSIPRGPKAGSPLYEHLSYDSGSESAEALKNLVQGKEATGAPLRQDSSKGSNFLATFLKKNMQLANVGQGNSKNTVMINGTVIPPDVLKIAEKRAGTIHPGAYWYDYEAGFWGVMGGPCLGIIPPFISGFKIPLAKNCAGGTTDILVNGRELHKKDIDALAGRGLPRTPGKSYMVDISGQVVDKLSGQMLRCLGRLAPTIQKRGRGYGMFQLPIRS